MSNSKLDSKKLMTTIHKIWDESIVPTLMDYIKIPNKSPAYDPLWQEHGYMEQAVTLMVNWCKQHPVKNMQLEVLRLPGRTPVILIEVPGQSDNTVLLYGHLDKQPEMAGWDADLDPWKPVLKGDKLYGRGGADDGYAIFSAMTAIKALQEQNLPHARCVILIEACEESGSFDLPYYVDAARGRIGDPELIICLDSGCGNYEQMWITTSLRGLISADLRVDVLSTGIHSGYASGIVPSSFRIIRQLLNRIEDEKTGKVLLEAAEVTLSKQDLANTAAAAKILGKDFLNTYPFLPGVQPVTSDVTEQLLNRNWRPTLSITGVAGIPSIENAGNVLRPFTALKLSIRLPPTCESKQAGAALKKTLETDPPYAAKVTVSVTDTTTGWQAPATAPWLSEAFERASQTYFGKPVAYMGEGYTIPFMGMLGEKFPQAQFMITGVLGPYSNAHGPNEFLHIPMGKQITCCVAQVLALHFIQLLQ